MNDLKKNVTTTTEGVNAIVIKNAGDCEKAAAVLKGVNGLIKMVKESFDPIIKKAKAAHSEALARKKAHLDPLEEAKKTIGTKILDYNEDQRRTQEAHKEENLATAEAAEDHLGTIEASTPTDIKTPVGVYFKDNWKAKIVDDSKIPREYLTPDMVKINAHGRSFKEKASIPGVEFYNDKTTVQRG